jgi:hypothetical protein
MIDLCLYEAGQEVMLDDSKASKSLTELIEPKTDKSVTDYDNKMINSDDKKVKIKKSRKLFKRKS